MGLNASAQFHMRFVTEKHRELTESLDELVSALVGEKLETKKARANASLQKANDLKSSISRQDCPAWLTSLITGLGYFVGGNWQQVRLIEHLFVNIGLVRDHKWSFEDLSESAFDFDSIFDHYKSQSRLPELFEEIVRILEEIRNSGEVDSVAMMAALSKVISTLRKNKDGSYFSINSAWSFLVSFLKNYMWAELSNFPVLGPVMEALETTIKEANEEMFRVHSAVQSGIKEVVEAEVKALKMKTEFRFIGYDRDGDGVPSTEFNSELLGRA